MSSAKLLFHIMTLAAVVGHAAMAQEHIQPIHRHVFGQGVCYGYAMGRSGGKSVGGACDPATLTSLEQQNPATWMVDPGYWDYVPGVALTGISQGDIVGFGAGHVAFVENVAEIQQPSHHYAINITEVPNVGGGVSPWILLTAVWNSPTWTYRHPARGGNPTASGYYRRKNFEITAQNKFNNGVSEVTNQGQVRIESDQGTSPLVRWKDWKNAITLTAINGQVYPSAGYRQIFQIWVLDQQGPSGNPATALAWAGRSNIHSARFDLHVETVFEINGLGRLYVDGVERTPPYTSLSLVGDPPIQIQAQGVPLVQNHLDYRFKRWEDGSTSNPRSFAAQMPVTHTLTFEPVPLPTPGVQAGGPVGAYVQITWQEHQNPYVSQYQIWRKVKPKNQWEGTPYLIATRNRGVHSYTDYEYTVTSGYTDDLVYYDVRAFYQPNGSTSDPTWVAVFAEQGPAKLASMSVSEDMLDVFPNPFNPSTRIIYSLADRAYATLVVFDLAGRQVAHLEDRELEAGNYSKQWNAGGLASGVYLVRLRLQNESGGTKYNATRKIFLAK